MIPTAARLDAARHEGDPALDPIVTSMGPAAWRIVAATRGLHSDAHPPPLELPAALRPFVIPELPASACRHRIRRAQRFANVHLPQITVALFCAALPMSYLSSTGARALSATRRLSEDIDARINHTARFVLDVLEPGGFDAGGRGRVAVGHVRLVHAAARASLAGRSPWDASGAQPPLDQEDQLGALCLFSVVVLQSLQRMGISVEPGDRDDFVHLWTTIGLMLGVRPDLLPADHGEAAVSLRRIEARRMGGSSEGRMLMHSLLGGMQRHVGLAALHSVPARLTRYLVGDARARLLGLDDVDVAASSPALEPVLGLGRTLVGSRACRAVAARFGRRLVEAINDAKLARARDDRNHRAASDAPRESTGACKRAR